MLVARAPSFVLPGVQCGAYGATANIRFQEVTIYLWMM